MCDDDPRVVDKVNSVQVRLLHMGRWVGTYQHYRFCVRSACITLPWQLETIEACARDNVPGLIRGEWYQYIKDGYGLLGSTPIDFQDLGDGWPAFDDVVGTDKKLRVYSDRAEAADATILLEFYNENKLPVSTVDGVEIINGEKVAISQVQTDTVNFCMANGLVAVHKPITNGNVFLYEYDTVTATQKLLAFYEADETLPNYRRYSIPYCNSNADDECSVQTVDIIAKKRFIPARKLTDILIIGNTEAVITGSIALRMERNNEFVNSNLYWALAKSILDQELEHFMGDGAQDVVQASDPIENGGILNLI